MRLRLMETSGVGHSAGRSGGCGVPLPLTPLSHAFSLYQLIEEVLSEISIPSIHPLLAFKHFSLYLQRHLSLYIYEGI